MLDERTLDDGLGRELHALVDDLQPRAGLADAAIARRRSMRRRAGVGGLGAVAAASAGVVLAVGGGASPARHSELHLAAYRFALPRDATTVAATPAACTLGAEMGFNVNPDTTPGVGASTPTQPAISSAITSQGGCVAMAISDPYTPGSNLAPFAPVLEEIDESLITIDGDTGTIGVQKLQGGVTSTGVTIPNGTTNNELTLTIPAANGQDQLLVVTAAGVSQSELQSIVASGLNQ